MPVVDQRFMSCFAHVAAKHPDVPIKHLAAIVADTLAEADAHTCDEIDLTTIFAEDGLNPGAAA